jgi:predicted ATPase with chaperone activity
VLLGELGLDGRLRPVGGVLPATLAAQQAGLTRVIVPLRQAGEANLVEGVDVFGLASITQLIALFQGVPRKLLSENAHKITDGNETVAKSHANGRTCPARGRPSQFRW